MLSPGPLHLLVAMSRGCTLRGVRARGNEIWYVLARPSGDIERVHGRGVNTLIRLEFIERAGDEAFRVAPAGRSWIAANLDKHSSHIATLRGSNVGVDKSCVRVMPSRVTLCRRHSAAEARLRFNIGCPRLNIACDRREEVVPFP